MKEIAKEHQIEWDTTDTEKELLKPPEKTIVCSSLTLPILLYYISEFKIFFSLVSYYQLLFFSFLFFIRKDHEHLLVPPVYLWHLGQTNLFSLINQLLIGNLTFVLINFFSDVKDFSDCPSHFVIFQFFFPWTN